MKKAYKILISTVVAVMFGAIVAYAGIPMSSNFTLNSGLPLDSRVVVADVTARDAIPAIQRFDGLSVYLVSTNATWQLQGGVTNGDWVNVTSGSSALTATQVGYGSAGNTLTGDANLLWTAASKELRINGTQGSDRLLVVGGGMTMTAGHFILDSTTSNSIFAVTNNTVNNSDVAIFTGNGLATNSVGSFRSSSANVGVRSLVNVQNTNAAAVNATPYEASNSAPTSTNYFRQIKLTAIGAGTTTNTIWQGNGTDPNGVLAGTAGDILINGSTNKLAYSTGGTAWTSLGGGSGDVTQAAAGTQATNSVPFYTSNAKEIAKTSALIWDNTNGGLSISGITDFALGSSANSAANLYFGKGKESTAPATSVFVSGTGAITTANTAGSSLRFRAGRGTGNSTGMEVSFATPDPTVSGSTQQNWSDNLTLGSTNKDASFYGRVKQTEGNNITAANDITLGDGNFFTVNGNTQVNTIATGNWSSAGANAGGAVVHLLFMGTPTIKNNTAGAGAVIITRTGADIVVVTPYVLTLVFDATNNVWRQPN